jgi:comEA protein
MKTPWMSTLGIVLSTGLFFMTLGAGATGLTSGEDDDAATIMVEAGQGDGENVALQHNHQAEAVKDADSPSFAADEPAESGGDPLNNESVEGSETISTAIVIDEKQEELENGSTQDKSTETVDLERQNESENEAVKVAESAVKDSDDADKPDTTHADEDDDTDEGDKVNINTATEDELIESLKGIGPSKAKEIIKYRDKNGAFKKIEHLKKVKGIGPATFAAIESQLVV